MIKVSNNIGLGLGVGALTGLGTYLATRLIDREKKHRLGRLVAGGLLGIAAGAAATGVANWRDRKNSEIARQKQYLHSLDERVRDVAQDFNLRLDPKADTRTNLLALQRHLSDNYPSYNGDVLKSEDWVGLRSYLNNKPEWLRTIRQLDDFGRAARTGWPKSNFLAPYSGGVLTSEDKKILSSYLNDQPRMFDLIISQNAYLSGLRSK